MSNNRQKMIQQYGFSARSRSQEFGAGATFIEKDQEGNATKRNALNAVSRHPLPYPETLDSHNEYLKDRAARYD